MRGLTVALGLVGIAAVVSVAGCAAPQRSAASALRSIEPGVVATQPSDLHLVSHRTPGEQPHPLTLDALLALTRAHNPDLAVAAARVTEARGEFVQAGLYPNPTVGYMGNQINDGPGTAGQQGAYVSQEIVTGGKRKVAQSAAAHGLTAADWQATYRWYDTAAKVRMAYYEYQTAQLILAESERIVEHFEEGLRKAEGLARAGMVLNYEVLRFRIELTQARNRVGAGRERIATARRMLAASVGVATLPAAIVDDSLPTSAPVWDFDQAVRAADASAAVQEALALADQAREQVRFAELKNRPNLQLQAAMMYDFALPGPMANAQAGVMLPVFDRNQGAILAARARLAAATAAVERERLKLRERLALADQKYRNARRQVNLYEKQVIPDAAHRSRPSGKDLRGPRRAIL